jgi:hypothetical protein
MWYGSKEPAKWRRPIRKCEKPRQAREKGGGKKTQEDNKRG